MRSWEEREGGREVARHTAPTASAGRFWPLGPLGLAATSSRDLLPRTVRRLALPSLIVAPSTKNMEARGSLGAPALDIPPADNFIEDARKLVLRHHLPLMLLAKHIGAVGLGR